MYTFIKDSLVQMHQTCGTDEWGQVAKHNFTPFNLFGERKDEVLQYLKTHGGIVTIQTYSASYGTYQAISIVDKTIFKECQEALAKNPNYRRNMTKW